MYGQENKFEYDYFLQIDGSNIRIINSLIDYKKVNISLKEFAWKFCDRLYDKRIEENAQCSGWYVLKDMVESGEIPNKSDWDCFHVLLRKQLKTHWKIIKTLK